MSYLNLNPANQTAGVSGSQIVILQSGSSAVVAIAGSVGGTTLVDVQSSVGSDNIGTGTDALSTQALAYGYNQTNDQWTRIFSVALRSGIANTVTPISGFALLSVNRIVGERGDTASVFQADDDDMFESDQLLQTAGRAYGLANEHGESGKTWVRIGATASGQGISGIPHKLAVAFSGDLTKSVITDRSNTSIGATVFSPDNDDLVGDNVLFAAAHNLGWYEGSGVWTRIRTVQTLSGRGNEFALNVSGFSLQTASLITDTDGIIVNVASQQGSDTSEVTSGDNAHSLSTLAKMYGLNLSGDRWARIRAIQPQSGQIGNLTSGFGLLTTSVIIDEGGKIANIRSPDDDTATTSEGALETVSKTHAYNRLSGSFARIDAVHTQSGGMPVASSGFALLTASVIGAPNFNEFVALNSVYTDDETGTSLETSAFMHGWNEGLAGWSRVRVTQSGQGVSGTPHRAVVAFSGDIVQIGEGGDIAEVINSHTDVMSNSDNALVVDSRLKGYVDASGGWVRLRATQSGQGVSGTPHRLVVAFSGDIIQIGEGGNVVDVQGSTTTDTVSTADNVLGTMGLNYAFNDVDGNWKRLRALGSGNNISGGAASGGYSLFVGVGDANNGRVARVTSPLTDDEPLDYSLYTASATLGHDGTNWDRIWAISRDPTFTALATSDIPSADTIDVSRITCTNNSGGTVLNTVTIRGKGYIQNESGNNVVNVGGNNAGDFPASNVGLQLFAGEKMEVRVGNFDMVAVWAATSGQRIRTYSEN